MEKKQISVGVIGGLGLMASPMARHWRKAGPVRVLRVHDRGTPGERRELSRKAWREHGAELVGSLQALVGEGAKDLDGIFVCAGKNGDDQKLIGFLARQLSGSGKFICHMSTISAGFAEAAAAFCAKQNVVYANYPLTGGATGAQNATMLILAGGPHALFEKLLPALHCLGKPKHFGERASSGAEVKFMGHMMVFNGLIGITSASVTHTACFDGRGQTEFFDFLNAGAGGTKQWDLVLRPAVANDVWDAPFQLKYAVVDAIYTAHLCGQKKISFIAADAMISTALAFSYVLNNGGVTLATQAIVKEMVAANAENLDGFILEHSASRGDIEAGLKKCIASLPREVKDSVSLFVGENSF